MTDSQKIYQAAFAHLRTGGFRFDDPDLLRLFDTSMIEVSGDRVVIPPSFLAKARTAKPDLFFDAVTANESEIKDSIAKLAREEARRQIAAEHTSFLAELRRKHSAAVDEDGRIDAMEMTDAEWRDALRRIR